SFASLRGGELITNECPAHTVRVRVYVSDHLSTQLLERYRRRRLEPAELLALDDHLATCAVCRERLRGEKPAPEKVNSFDALLALRASLQAANQAAPEHLPREQLQAYAEGRLDAVDRELAESHLESCPPCAAQAQQLCDSAQWQARAADITPLPSDVPQPSLWAKLVAVLKPPSLRGRFLAGPQMLRVAGVVAAMALLVLAVALWVREKPDRREIASPPTPPPSPSQPPVVSPPDAQPARNAPIVLALNDGDERITLDARGNFTGLESLPAADQQRVKTALTTQKVRTPKALRELRDSAGALMGGATGAAFTLLSPVGKVVASERPTLRWRPFDGAISYQVTITDPEAGYKEVAVSPELQGTEWTVNRQLERGRVYTWQVTARTQGGEVKSPAPNREAKFQVLGRAKAIEVARAKKIHAGRHLTLGLLYAQAGLLDEAEGEFQALVASNPQSPVARKLLRAVRRRR
ncbi:MAG TPA: zf-HC2 domain-containing protein, partial [Blastocatellia bacterium]|nr:zf-HC2 domain-containing protein [Blastocatellia bacterium]